MSRPAHEVVLPMTATGTGLAAGCRRLPAGSCAATTATCPGPHAGCSPSPMPVPSGSRISWATTSPACCPRGSSPRVVVHALPRPTNTCGCASSWPAPGDFAETAARVACSADELRRQGSVADCSSPPPTRRSAAGGRGVAWRRPRTSSARTPPRWPPPRSAGPAAPPGSGGGADSVSIATAFPAGPRTGWTG